MRKRSLSRVEASAYLDEKHNIQHSPAYLAKLAHTGGGPAYFRLKNKLSRYWPDGLDTYAESIASKPARSAAEHDVAVEGSSLLS
jgi:hypothetical protein